MHSWPSSVRMLATLLAGLVLASLALVGLGLAAEVLINPGLNNPTSYQDTGRDPSGPWPDQVAAGWWWYYLPETTYHGSSGADKLHWMSSAGFAAAFGGLDYHREGDSAQVVWSSYDMDGGIYQQVRHLQPGQAYAFEVGMASFWRGSSYPRSDGMITKCLGIDPWGGSSPTAPTVIWDWEGCDSSDKTWPYLDIAATAQTPTMTLFVRIQAPDNQSYNHYDLNYVFIDDAHGALAPTTTLTTSLAGGNQIDVVVGAQVLDADWRLQGIEVQYRQGSSGAWTTLQGRAGLNTRFTIAGQPGETYSVRARAWQKRPPEEHVNYDLPGVWVERRVQPGGCFQGVVYNNFGARVAGALVSLSGTGVSALSGTDGAFGLAPPSYGQPYWLTVSASGYRSPLPLSASVPSANDTTPVTLTLKPINDAVVNGDFEASLAGWTKAGSGQAVLFSNGRRSGQASLRLNGPVTLSQQLNLTNVRRPTLHFWLRPVTFEGGGYFEAELRTTNASRLLTVGEPGDWQPRWLSLDLPGNLSGPATITFRLTGAAAQVELDEVSLGNGGHSLFVPVIIYGPSVGPEPGPSPSPSPSPMPTPIPGVTPTATPIPTPPASNNDFRLATVRLLSITENGGCSGNHHVFLSAVDNRGNPLLGVVISDPPTRTFRVVTGEKYEPFFSYGTKLAEIPLYNNGTYLKAVEYPIGRAVTSDQTPLLSTNTWEIPVAWLIEAGYCSNEAECSGRLCQGHYSYWVVFQKTAP